MKMKTNIKLLSPLSPSVVKNRNREDSAYPSVSLFSRLNLERGSFTFSNLYRVTSCF